MREEHIKNIYRKKLNINTSILFTQSYQRSGIKIQCKGIFRNRSHTISLSPFNHIFLIMNTLIHLLNFTFCSMCTELPFRIL